MHVLFFTYDVPYPPNSGGKTRALNLLKYAKKNNTYSLFTFTRPGFDLSYLEELKKIGIETIELFPRKSLKSPRHIKALVSKKQSIFSSLYFDHAVSNVLSEYVKKNKVNLIHFESFYTGFYISDEFSQLGIKQVYGSENREDKIYEEMLPRVNSFLRPFLRREVEKVRKEEAFMASHADCTLAVTVKEKEYFESVSQKPVYVVENGIEIDNFPQIELKKHTKVKLLFIGNFSYYPNVDGLTHFYKDIFSKLDTAKFELLVVGRGVSQFNFLKNQSVETIEYVPDVYDAYAMAGVFVSPIRIGGGTNFKVLEAMAAGLPVVSYIDKTDDMGFVDGRDILQARNKEDFITWLKKLDNSVSLRETIGKNARQIVSKLYSWERIGGNLNTIWKNLYEAN